MYSSRAGRFASTLLFLLTCAGSHSAVAAPPADEARQLVKQALRAEVLGQTREREALLTTAIQMDPSFAPARWLRGELLIDDGKSEPQWLTVDAAESRAAANPALSEYASLRKQQADNATGNEFLAEWCQRRGMAERAQVHWARVLQHQPQHRTALRRLDLKRHQGRWFTSEQLVLIKQRKVHAATLRRKWLPTLHVWRKAFLGRDRVAQQEARTELTRVVDAELVGLFETQLSPYDEQLAVAVVSAVGSLKEQSATESLVRHAILSKWPAVREAAVEQLKGRPPHGYVPILIDAMLSPFEFQTWTSRSSQSDHVLALNYSVAQKGKHADRWLAGTLDFIGEPANDRADDVREEMLERIEELNEAAKKFNEPIWQALKSTTKQDLEDDPSEWNDWWNDYNEYYVPEYKPVITSYRRQSIVAIQPYSCFPPGTLVSTETGARPIESIRAGDYVLSQDARTGELAYQPVLETTKRQSDAIVEIQLDNERLLATRGHPIWVNGRQWQMAKQLRHGDILHGVNSGAPGALPRQVQGIRSAARDSVVHNLVVANFHTYFVGNSRVFVHDNSIYTPPGVSTPGE